MGIGQYRHRVTLKDPAVVLNPVSWDCAIQSVATQVVDGLAAFFVRGRFHPGITLETQMLFEGRTFQVQSITDLDERHTELQLMCVEVVGRRGTSASWPSLSYQETVLADGAVAYWPLDDPAGSTTARDAVGTRTATINGGVTFGAAGAGGGSTAAAFDGTGWVTVPPVPIANFTLEVWTYYTPEWSGSRFADGQLVRRQGQLPTLGTYIDLDWYGTSDGADINVYLVDPAAANLYMEFLNVSLAAWHHVVLTYDGGAVRLYVDTVLSPTSPFTTALAIDAPPITMEFGRRTPTADYVSGRLQDVAFYPRALTAEEIAAHYSRRMTTHG